MPKPDHFIAIKMDIDCQLSFYARRANGDAERWQKTNVQLGGKILHTSTAWVKDEDRDFQQTLLVPVSRRAVESMRALIDMGVMDGGRVSVNKDDPANPVTETESEVPFYFSMSMLPDPAFERKGKIPLLIGGPETRYFPDSLEMKQFSETPPQPSSLLRKIWNELTWQPGSAFDSYTRQFRKDPDSLPRARVNCWTFAQGLTEYYARVDLGRIDPVLSTSHRAWQAQTWLMTQLGEVEPEWTSRHPGREFRLPGEESKIIALQNDPALQPALVIDKARSFAALLDQDWVETGTETVISPIKDIFPERLKLFGEDEELRPLPAATPKP